MSTAVTRTTNAPSPLELAFDAWQRRLGLGFTAEHGIRSGGYLITAIDFYHPLANVAVYLDGKHHLDLAQWRRDHQTRNWLQVACSMTVIVVPSVAYWSDGERAFAMARHAVAKVLGYEAANDNR